MDEIFNRDWLENYLEEIDEFTRKHGVPVAVNEFGVMRWEPGAAEFIDDEYITRTAENSNKACLAGSMVRHLLKGAASRKGALRKTGLKKYVVSKKDCRKGKVVR